MDLRLQKIVLNELKRGDFDYIDKFMKEKGLREGIGLKPLFALFLGEYKFRCMRKKDENKN